MPLYLLVTGPILVATLGYFLPRRIFRAGLLAFQIAQTALAGYLLIIVRSQGTILQQVGAWPPGVGIALRADLLGTTMVFFTALMYLFLFLYSFRKQYTDNMFQFLYIVMQGVTISVFLSQDIFNLYVLIEVMTIIISVLIMWKRDKQALYDGTVYLLINLFAMSFFLLGIGLLYRTTGVLSFQALEAHAQQLTDPRSLILPLSFILTAVSLKAALMPLFSWLPHAHGTPSAPSIVSAVLSGLLIKVGVYLYIRLQGIFSAAIVFDQFFLIVGAGTAIVGIALALTQRNIKLILAYSTVSQIGLIMVGLNSGVPEAYWGSVFHILNHGLFKALLFLTAGAIAKEYGTKDLANITGAMRRIPIVSIAALLAILGIIGTPFFNGSISKYLIQSGFSGVSEVMIYVINFGTTLVFVKYATMFFGNSGVARRSDPDPFVNAVSFTMGLVILGLGLAARPVISYLFSVEVSVAGAFYANKFLAWILTVVAAIPVYYFGVRRAGFLTVIRQARLNFPDMALLLIVFLATLMSWLSYSV